MKKKYFLLFIMICFECACTTIHTTTRHTILNYKDAENSTSPIKSLKITQITNTTRTHSYNNLFPAYAEASNGRDQCSPAIPCYIGMNVVGIGIPLATDIISFIPLFLYDLIVPTSIRKDYKYETTLSMQGKVVDRENNPVKNLQIPCNIVGSNYLLSNSLDCQITTNQDGYFTYDRTKSYQLPWQEKDSIKQADIGIEFKPSNSNLSSIHYKYPFKNGTMLIETSSGIKESSIKLENNVIFGNFKNYSEKVKKQENAPIQKKPTNNSKDIPGYINVDGKSYPIDFDYYMCESCITSSKCSFKTCIEDRKKKPN